MVGFDVTKIPWDKIKNPSPTFKLFEPSKEKFGVIYKHLMDGYLNLSDQFRFKDTIFKLIRSYFYDPSNFIYEIGDNQALVGFINIIPNFKADLMFKLFDPSIWKLSIVKEGRELFRFIIEQFALRRINTATPDERVLRMAKMLGFKVDGIRKNNFMFNNKPYNEYLLGIHKEK